MADEFLKSAKAAGAQIVTREYTTNQSTDFAAILTNIKSKKPDIVFYGGMDAQAGPLLNQMKQLGLSAKVMGGDGMCTTELPKLASGGMADNQVVCAEAGGVTKEFQKGWDDFRARYKKKFNDDVKLYAPYVYDATMVMAEAMKKANSADPKKYLPVLAKISTKGVSGPISFDANGDIKGGTLTLYTYKGGNRESLGVVK